jgi:fermentation-respiration switch protein FrsA (DUF1100 family)
VVAVVVVAALLLTLLWVFQRNLIYFPHPADTGRASQVLPGAQDVTLKTADRLELGAWFVPASGADRGVTVLVANGNAGNRSMRAPLAAALARAGLSVLLFDYRGFGGNPGTPTEEGLARDARAAHRFLVDDAGIRPDRLLYYGESLGAAVVTRLATEHPPAGLVLRSPFVDLASVGRVHYPFLPVQALVRDRYPVADSLTRVAVPTTVVYGTADSIVPADQSRAVAAAAAGPTRAVAIMGADHNDPALLDGPQLIAAVVELADRVRLPL